MKLSDIVEKLDLEVRAAKGRLDTDVTGVYASDLLSDVMAHAREGNVWLTLQSHQNVIAVAVMKDLAGIILVGGREPLAETVQKAEAEGIPVLVSSLPTYELSVRLHQQGLGGTFDNDKKSGTG
ncbi:MAG: serine kinase [Planctomycetes bacterium]|nr:serine kinase [Planctomycetota bacterium]